MSAIPQACTTFQAGLTAMAQAANIGLMADWFENGRIRFSNPGTELDPLEPVIRVGRGFGQSRNPRQRVARDWTGRVLVSRACCMGYFVDEGRIQRILGAPLGEYLPEKDPRTVGDEETQGRMWDLIRERSVHDLIDSVRTARAVNWVWDSRHPSQDGTIALHGYSFLQRSIESRGARAELGEEKRLAHMLISALLLYEINEGSKQKVDVAVHRVSEVADKYAEGSYHDGSAMLYELALSMLPHLTGTEELRVELSAKAAREWFEALMGFPLKETFVWCLWRGMRLAWDGNDLSLLGKFHDLYAKKLLEGEQRGDHNRAPEARVRHAFAEMERLKRADWDLGERADNQEAWEVIAAQLKGANDLFAALGRIDITRQIKTLNEKVHEIRSTI